MSFETECKLSEEESKIYIEGINRLLAFFIGRAIPVNVRGVLSLKYPNTKRCNREKTTLHNLITGKTKNIYIYALNKKYYGRGKWYSHKNKGGKHVG